MTKQLVTLSSDLTVITAEINSYKRIAGDAIFEIGRRLKHVKENDLAHGQWERWCKDKAGFDSSTARKFIAIVDRLSPANRATWHEIGWRALYEIATLPPEERERDHTLKSGETKSPAEMTVRELREVKEALRKAEEARRLAEDRAEQLAEQNAVLADTAESLASAPPPLPRIEVQTEYVADPALSERLKRYEARYGDIDGEVTERISNHTEVDGAAAAFADDVQTLLMSYAHLTTFKSAFTGITDEAYDEYKSSLDALREFVNGMQRVLDGTPKGKAEVIDITDYQRKA